MLSGDWEAEYEAMSEGDPMYLKAGRVPHVLPGALRHSPRWAGATGAQPPVRDEHLQTRPRAGRPGRPRRPCADPPEGLATEDGVIDYVSSSFLGVRTNDARYRFIYGFTGIAMVGHHLFSVGVDQARAEREWRSWLERLFAGDDA